MRPWGWQLSQGVGRQVAESPYAWEDRVGFVCVFTFRFFRAQVYPKVSSRPDTHVNMKLRPSTSTSDRREPRFTTMMVSVLKQMRSEGHCAASFVNSEGLYML